MYRDIMEFKSDTPDEELAFIKELCIRNHKDKDKEIKLIQDPNNKYRWHFEGEYDVWGLLNWAWLQISDSNTVKKYIKSWQWEDENPKDSGSILESLNKPFKHRDGRITRWEPKGR